MSRWALCALMVVVAVSAPGQSTNYPYVLKNFAGTFPLGDGGPAAAALLYAPSAVAMDGSGNLFVLDAGNYRVRKVALDGTISTAVQLPIYGYDLKVGKDGSFYLTGEAMVFKVTPGGPSPYGQVTVIAGNGTPGTSQDGGPAVSALLSANTGGIALDSAGDVYFVDGNRVREVTTDGIIHTAAGTTSAGGYNGDSQTAVTAQLNSPWGLAVDAANNLYIADQFNSRVRKVSSGMISTIAGTGSLGVAVEGPATASPLGTPYGLAVDGAGNVYVTDIALFWTVKIGSDGSLKHVAGNGSGLTSFGYTDGPATASYLYYPAGIAVDGSGNLFIAEEDGNRIRKVAAGNLQTVAGHLHFGGDGGPAAVALLNQPQDTALDAKGNIFVADYANYRVRKVAPDGTIATFAGNGIPNTPDDGSPASNAPLPDIWATASDAAGNVYLATTHKVLEISTAGVITTVAGTGAYGDTGDGFPANKAAFKFITGVAVDTAGNVYIADSAANRVRKVSAADGSIVAFAGAGTAGYTGDNGIATNAQLNLYYSDPAPLAVDAKGNVYIGDYGNSAVRRVDVNGTITTVAGYGAFGSPTDGQAATATPISFPSGLTVDASGNLYIVAPFYNAIYRVDTTGVIQHISGGGKVPLADGVPATQTIGFEGAGIKVDGNKDLYVPDPTNMVVHKLVYNSPTGLAMAGGNSQTGPAGSMLLSPLKVLVNGRGGAGVAGATVNFTVSPAGAATVSSANAITDATGTAQVNVTLGSIAGAITVSAAIAGSNLTPVAFSVSAGAPNSNCLIAPPVVSSVQVLSGYGSSAAIASGSWIEVHGSNLAIDTRSWANTDFTAGVAPTTLDGTSVAVDGIPGFIGYISPQQVNVLTPSDPFTGQVQIVAANCAGTSAPVSIQKSSIAPALLAPPNFVGNGKQYLAALLPDGKTYEGSPGNAPARPGDSLSTLGIGFGPVSPATPTGTTPAGATSIAGLTISFGTTPAAVSYAGLSPSAVGLYQFNFTVPTVASGDYPINVSVGGTPVQQLVYLTVQQ